MLSKKYQPITIVGAGVAGLSLALYLHEKQPNLPIFVYAKTGLSQCNSYMAQGGIAIANINKDDSFESHIQDTAVSGHYKGNLTVIKKVVEESPTCLNDLVRWGVKFDSNTTGFDFHKEGGHQHHRIVHIKDQTGKYLHHQLVKKCFSIPEIHISENIQVIDIIQSKKNYLLVTKNQFSTHLESVMTDKVILATGGSGHIFPDTTNAKNSIGEGVYLASKLGLAIKDMGYYQFHPTVLFNKKTHTNFLISEAARGYGAYLINDNRQRFMFKYTPKGELAPRDIVCNGIWNEMEETKSTNVFLSFEHLNKEKTKLTFPNIYEKCLAFGYDFTKTPIPVRPAAHYQCGGIVVNENGETSKKGIFALGECAFTGLHGANRLASNSLLEALVYAKNAADFISNQTIPETQIKSEIKVKHSLIEIDKNLTEKLNSIKNEIKQLMFVGYRNQNKLRTCLVAIQQKADFLTALKPKKAFHPLVFEIQVLLNNSKLILLDCIKKYEKRNISE